MGKNPEKTERSDDNVQGVKEKKYTEFSLWSVDSDTVELLEDEIVLMHEYIEELESNIRDEIRCILDQNDLSDSNALFFNLDLGDVKDKRKMTMIQREVRSVITQLIREALEESDCDKQIVLIGRKLGEGGYSRVYECCLDGDNNVAMKIYRPIIKERDLLKFLQCNNIFEVTQKSPYLVSLYDVYSYTDTVSGEKSFAVTCEKIDEMISLNEYLFDYNIDCLLKFDLIVFRVFLEKIYLPLLEGLKAMHKADPAIVHSDMKCDNVFLKLKDEKIHRVYLSDFDLSMNAEFNPLRPFNQVRGTYYYMPPEIWLGKANTVYRDIYAFGRMLYRIFDENRRGFPHNLHLSLLYSNAEYYDVSDIEAHPGVKELLIKCLQRNPENRPDIDCLINLVKDLIDEYERDYQMSDISFYFDGCTRLEKEDLEKEDTESDIPTVPENNIDFSDLKKNIPDVKKILKFFEIKK